MSRLAECTLKIRRVREEMARRDAKGVAIRKQNNFAWATSGGRGFIGLASEMACCALVITVDEVYLISNNIESGRLIAEELPEGLAQGISVPWQQDGRMGEKIAEICGGAYLEDSEMEPFFKPLRLQLNEDELRRFAILGGNSAKALEAVCRTLKPGMTEFEVAGDVSRALWAHGIEPITMLVAADDRSDRVRHYVPTENAGLRGFIVSICARRWGLIASATRVVAFDGGFAARDEALAQVECTALDAIVAGQPVSSVYRALCAAYARAGMEGEEDFHHQGGLTGYMAREVRAEPTSELLMQTGQAFAWNPSAKGIKCEDTVALTGSGLKILTPAAAEWPTVTLGGRRRPLALRL